MQFLEQFRYISFSPLISLSSLHFLMSFLPPLVVLSQLLVSCRFPHQAARKTAENAINLRRVDEQVNRAVMAANRAATAARVAAVKAVQNRMDGKFCDTNV